MASDFWACIRIWRSGSGRGYPRRNGDFPLTVMERIEQGEANVAARVGYSVALGDYLAAGPKQVGERLAEVGKMTREALADVRGWRVVEAVDEPTAITTLAPVDGADPQQVRARLIAEHGIVTTYAETLRAPFEMTSPVLRASPHVDVTATELEQFVEALAAATDGASRPCAR